MTNINSIFDKTNKTNKKNNLPTYKNREILKRIIECAKNHNQSTSQLN